MLTALSGETKYHFKYHVSMKVLSTRFWLVTSCVIGAIFFNSASVHAASSTVDAGQQVTLTAVADGTAPFTYQWYKDSAIINGATNSTYVIASFQSGNAGTYYATVSNSAGSTTSDNAVLTLSSAVAVAPAFTTQPSSQTVAAGSPVTFTAAASGTPAPTFQWKKGGVNISGATSASYTISSTVAGDAGSYTVVATNSAGSATSNAATLTVTTAVSAPTITTQPASQTIAAGNSVTFSVVATGSPTYYWHKNGVFITGANSSTYTISNVTSGDAGTYMVAVINSAGSLNSNDATLTVTTATSAPAFTTQPASQTVTAGGSVTFTAAASGNPSPTYQWKKGGSNISGATSASYTISSVVTGDASTYTVVATNSAGSATSNGAVLTVNSTPVITTQPVSQAVTVGAPVTFSVVASGSPTPTYRWKKNGTNISGATNSTYTISSTTTGSAASYTVTVTNSVGAVTSDAAILTVNPATSAPAFTTQPASQTVSVGNPVTFNAVASGSPTPTYQWKKGGVNISGATSASYTISSVALGDANTYTVVATNSAGSVTSANATLSVVVAPSNAIVLIAIE